MSSPVSDPPQSWSLTDQLNAERANCDAAAEAYKALDMEILAATCIGASKAFERAAELSTAYLEGRPIP